MKRKAHSSMNRDQETIAEKSLVKSILSTHCCGNTPKQDTNDA